MEAHYVLAQHGFNISSYGTGSLVRLPGPSIDKPNVYQFGTPYEEIYQDLIKKDPQLYTQTGLLKMLDRNRRTKLAPEQWQGSRKVFDVIFTCEERCFDAVVEELLNRGAELNAPVHVINVEIKDNHEDAAVGGKLILDLATRIESSPDREHEIPQILEDFQATRHANLLHTVCYF
ncbi:RNA polymerase II subunit A C-terminal domain phosphatase [Blyttiomyces sp. JEL0837]|nr:RNA polymerase II subunit A C-terminal domain phosphatase [Blyttiomyces sp. JEL0837]